MEASVALALPRERARPITPVGRRLKEVLRERGWTLSRLAERSGVSVSQLSLLTTGKISHPRSNTLEAICAALGIPESALLGTRLQRADLRAAEGVVTVPFVRVGPNGELERTGFTVPVAASQLDGRPRVFVADVDVGMAPHVLTGDTVLVDPDAAPASGQLILGTYRKATRVAWTVDRDLVRGYWVEGEDVWLDGDLVRRLGEVLYIMRSPPRFRGS